MTNRIIISVAAVMIAALTAGCSATQTNSATHPQSYTGSLRPLPTFNPIGNIVTKTIQGKGNSETIGPITLPKKLDIEAACIGPGSLAIRGAGGQIDHIMEPCDGGVIFGFSAPVRLSSGVFTFEVAANRRTRWEVWVVSVDTPNSAPQATGSDTASIGKVTENGIVAGVQPPQQPVVYVPTDTWLDSTQIVYAGCDVHKPAQGVILLHNRIRTPTQDLAPRLTQAATRSFTGTPTA